MEHRGAGAVELDKRPRERAIEGLIGPWAVGPPPTLQNPARADLDELGIDVLARSRGRTRLAARQPARLGCGPRVRARHEAP